MLGSDHFEETILESDFENMNIGELHIIYEKRNKTRTDIYKAEVKAFFEEFIKGLGPKFQELFSKIIANASQIVNMAKRPHKSYPESGLLPILDEASLSIHSYCSNIDLKRTLINRNPITISLLFFPQECQLAEEKCSTSKMSKKMQNKTIWTTRFNLTLLFDIFISGLRESNLVLFQFGTRTCFDN